jgi:hypothetical protein
MSLFKSEEQNERCGVVVDIGSGSVGIALVLSREDTNELQVIWSHREYMLIKDVSDQFALLKDINTTLINAFLELGSSGIAALHTYNHKLVIKYMQIALCAPWAFTVTKSIQFEDEHPFEVTQDMLDELLETAKKESRQEEVHGELIEKLGVRIIAEMTVHVELNGYFVQNPLGHTCRSIKLSHITALGQEKLLLTLKELHNKIVPKAEVHQYSFMYIFYQVLRHLHPNTTEVCLLTITNETTEIGLVRDDLLSYSTFAPYGLYTLAREISAACDIPKEEAYGLLKNNSNMSSLYGGKNKEKIEAVFTAYEAQIAQLFSNTGDALTIPRTIFLHTSQNTESFFSKRIKNAAQQATGGTHTIHLFTSELLGDKTMTDTALALSVYFFHAKHTYTELEGGV